MVPWRLKVVCLPKAPGEGSTAHCLGMVMGKNVRVASSVGSTQRKLRRARLSGLAKPQLCEECCPLTTVVSADLGASLWRVA